MMAVEFIENGDRVTRMTLGLRPLAGDRIVAHGKLYEVVGGLTFGYDKVGSLDLTFAQAEVREAGE